MNCLICLDPDPAPDGYHPGCLEPLFGAPRLPTTTLSRANFRVQADRVLGKMSISGAQPKLSLQRSADGARLLQVERGGHFLIKPQTEKFPFTPENEHLSMRLAELCGVTTARCGLLRLVDGSLAYLTRRFDRSLDIPPRKLHQVDFCQLARQPPERRDNGTAEQCATLARSHAADPEAAVRALFRLLLFGYWIGNGDLHLKNLALLVDNSRRHHLAPAYDLLSTHLYGDESLTLPVNSRTRDLKRGDWLLFAEDACLIPRAEAVTLIDELLKQLPAAVALIDRSYLPEGTKPNYQGLLIKRTRALQAVAPRTAP